MYARLAVTVRDFGAYRLIVVGVDRTSGVVPVHRYSAHDDAPHASYDGTLTGTGEYTEIRKWNPNSRDPDPELYFDDTCEPTEDPSVQYCHSRTYFVGGFELSGADDYNLTRTSDGVVTTAGHGRFPANTTYRVDVPAGDYGLSFKSKQTDDESWIAYEIPTSSPLDTDNLDGFNYKEDQVATVDSEDALYDSGKRITLYYNDSENVQYVRFMGNAELDDGWHWGAHERPFDKYKIVFENQSG